MIHVESLRIDYENVTAVCDLSLDVAPGQIYGLVGPNGAGKTSTLKALAGIIAPTYGEIKIAGYDLALNAKEALQQVGFMPDFPPMYENLKVNEYLEVFAVAYLMDPDQRLKKARAWVEMLNLAEKWNSYVRELSRGMRQRLVLAKTLLHEPKVLLLDEPASGLDPLGRKDMRDILKRVATSDKAIIISSHILTELSDFCNAVGIMEKGRLVVSGPIEKIRESIGIKGQLIIHVAETNERIESSLRTLLEQSSHVLNCEKISPLEFRASFSGEKAHASLLLRQLIENKIPIAQFFIKEANFEDIFLKIGAKQVT